MCSAFELRIPTFLAGIALCASCANVDVHFGSDQIPGGLGYWKYGVGRKPIYSLHWIGDTISVSDGYANADTFTIAASECTGLNEAKVQLLRDVAAGVTALVDSPPTPLPEEVLADAALHRLVYHPQGDSDRLELSGFEDVSLRPWIKSAGVLRKIVRKCRDS